MKYITIPEKEYNKLVKRADKSIITFRWSTENGNIKEDIEYNEKDVEIKDVVDKYQKCKELSLKRKDLKAEVFKELPSSQRLYDNLSYYKAKIMDRINNKNSFNFFGRSMKKHDKGNIEYHLNIMQDLLDNYINLIDHWKSDET